MDYGTSETGPNGADQPVGSRAESVESEKRQQAAPKHSGRLFPQSSGNWRKFLLIKRRAL